MWKFLKACFKLILWGSVTILVCVALANAWVLSYSSVDEVNCLLPREYMLVLGTSKFTKGGKINPYYKHRIDSACHLYNIGKVKKIIVSGHNPSRYYNEPATMREDLIKMGVPEKDIILDLSGLRTIDSVMHCKNKFGVSDPIIITQKYHASRSLFLARNLGLDGAIAYSAKSPKDAEYTWRNQGREVLARVRAVLDVYILENLKNFE